MKYAIKNVAFKLPGGQSANQLIDAIGLSEINGHFENYDSEKVLKKSRHLSAATKLWSSTAIQLTQETTLKKQLEQQPNKIGVYLAIENINLEDDFLFDLCAKNYGPDYVSPLQAPNTLANVVGSHFARSSTVQGPNCTVSGGTSGGAQAIDLALMNLDNGATNIAVVGGVEVKSRYHEKMSCEQKEAAIACSISHADDSDNVVFYPPAIRTNVIARASDLAECVRSLLSKYSDSIDVDMVVLASGVDGIEGDGLCSALASAGITQTVLMAEQVLSKGEVCNGLLSMVMVQELLDTQIELDQSLQSAVVGPLVDKLNKVVVATCDESGQMSAVLMECQSC